MRKYITLFFSALLFVWACKYTATPKGILKPDDMVRVLAEVHIVDGSINSIDAPNPDSLYKYGYGRYLGMFKRMHTDSAQFRASVKYYAQHPQQFEDIYTQVVKILQEKTDSLTKPAKKANTHVVPRE